MVTGLCQAVLTVITKPIYVCISQFQSISRQHAVINVLNGKQFMLMDLGSANKTKLNNVSSFHYALLNTHKQLQHCIRMWLQFWTV